MCFRPTQHIPSRPVEDMGTHSYVGVKIFIDELRDVCTLKQKEDETNSNPFRNSAVFSASSNQASKPHEIFRDARGIDESSQCMVQLSLL